ncbi:MAG TPA: preprotein translocase subunit SecY [Bryobacteraceae bacterium]|nr:preprotein translocase subunit SecY [Bryobacteraceae bacterium]
MGKLFEAVANIFRIRDLRNRLLFTLGLLAVYRLGSYVPTPGINTARWLDFMTSAQGSIFGFFDLFAGGNIRRLSVFALGIMPYITASIILQLLTVVVPTLEKLQKEGELGRRKITQWTRYLTVGLGIAQSFGIAIGLQSSGQDFVIHPGIGFVLLTILSLTTGTAFIMWLGEQITERGVGNGMSLIIFTGIVVGLPNAISNIYVNVFVTREWNIFELVAILVMMVAVVAFIVLVEMGERRIPVQYAKRVIGRRVMGGQSTHMPLKVNAGGVIPVIFASSILAFPQTIANTPFVKNNAWLSSLLGSIRHAEPLYVILFVALIIFFCFFYVSIIFNPNEAADNMRKYGGFIPGIRPGRSTSDYMNTILTRITFVGAIYLSILCLIPDIMISGIHLQHLPVVGGFVDAHFPRFLLEGLNVQFYFGGTSLLIVVGVAMDTINQVEAQLIMRHYEGFTPRAGRVRGRRSSV